MYALFRLVACTIMLFYMVLSDWHATLAIKEEMLFGCNRKRKLFQRILHSSRKCSALTIYSAVP